MIGLFIGSFNPPTLAHLKIALKLKNRFSKIVFVPVNSKDKNLIDIKKRIMMLNIYTNRFSFLEIDDIMNNYSYLNYRIIDLLKEKYLNVEIIMGSDLLERFNHFDNYEYLLDNYCYVIIPRNGIDTDKLIKEKYLKYQNKFTILDYQNDVSSTMARERLKENKELKNIIDQDILDYIKKNDLY